MLTTRPTRQSSRRTDEQIVRALVRLRDSNVRVSEEPPKLFLYSDSLWTQLEHKLGTACPEVEETPIHVMLQCNGVAEQRAAHLGSSATLHEALSDRAAC
ncbi:jg3261 [Pararge aegeria aegeria]|uniref:Jg3261 protein n=1 Tax=Pararge aegeria aegeria TaxID=348720 RepID=A0A8S4RTJ5_9NEOP|nr:jg3261 [Pararge aegeria aegeria]